jgi:GTPase SAR1 family protein
LTPIYYRGAKAAILVYDVTCAETFKKVKKWTAELREFNKEANTIAIAGNKIDLKNSNINEEEILKLLHSNL